MKITFYQGRLYINDVRVVSVILDRPTEAGTSIVTEFPNVQFEDLSLTPEEKQDRVIAEALSYLKKSKAKVADGTRTNIELERQLQNVVVGSSINCGGDFKIGG